MGAFLMPSLGADMEVGTVYDWRVKPGDHVRRGDIIVTIGTDKGLIDVEVFEDGVVDELVVGDGEEVKVGTLLARITADGGDVEPAAAPAVIREEPHPMDHHASPALAVPVARAAPTNGRRLKASPVARRLAAELGVDLTTVTGTGARGVIQRADVERAAAATTPASPPSAPPRASRPAAAPQAPDFAAGMRRAIARAMSRANRDIPHYYLETRIDMSTALRWLAAANEKRSLKERILPAVLFVKATALALNAAPELNGYWTDDALRVQEAIHIGLAIALRQGGLVTPAIHHADMKNLDELMATMRDLITRARSGRLRGSELTDATITITNLGDTGVERVFGVIYPPQVALVGIGRITDEVWVAEGMIGVRPTVAVTLAGDHRASDGRRGGHFLDALNKYLQEPDIL